MSKARSTVRRATVVTFRRVCSDRHEDIIGAVLPTEELIIRYYIIVNYSFGEVARRSDGYRLH